jgi:muconolactone delta-isomerase
MPEFFVHHVFRHVNHFHQFHLNQVQDWNELKHLVLYFAHFNQLRFREVLKFFVQNAFQIAGDFHHFHLNQIQDQNELNHLHFRFAHFNQFRFHEVCNSSMVLHPNLRNEIQSPPSSTEIFFSWTSHNWLWWNHTSTRSLDQVLRPQTGERSRACLLLSHFLEPISLHITHRRIFGDNLMRQEDKVPGNRSGDNSACAEANLA